MGRHRVNVNCLKRSRSHLGLILHVKKIAGCSPVVRTLIKLNFQLGWFIIT